MSGSIELGPRARLDAVRLSAEQGARQSPDEARAILEARARKLARAVTTENELGVDALVLLLFQVGDERLAIPLSSVLAIARTGSIAPLPRAIRPVYGVTAWRGRALTVLSLSTGTIKRTSETRLLVLGSGARAALAIVVDAVHDVAQTAHALLTPAAEGPRSRYALGISSDGLLVVSGDVLSHPDNLLA